MFNKILRFFGFGKTKIENSCEIDTIPNFMSKPRARAILTDATKNLINCDDLLQCLKLYKIDNLYLFETQIVNDVYQYRPLNNFLIPVKNFKHGLDKNGNIFFEFYFELFTNVGNSKLLISKIGNFLINCNNYSYLISNSIFDIEIENGIKYITLKISKK